MSERLAERTGKAFLWKALQLAGGKSILLIRTLILARLLAPDDFGLLAIALIGVEFLTQITDFGMQPALVQRAEVDHRHYNAAWTVNVTRAAGITVVVLLGAPIIAGIFDEPRAVDLIRVVAFRPLLRELASIKLASLIRELRFRPLAMVELTEVLLNTSVSIALAPFFGVWALVAGTLAGATSYTLLSYVVAPHRPRLSYDTTVVGNLVRFGRWIFLVSLVSVVSGATIKVAIARLVGTEALGFYYLAMKLALLPVQIADEMLGGVTFPLYARLQDDRREATAAFRSILLGALTILLPVVALMVTLSPSFVEHVLGPRWDGTVLLIRILALVGLAGLFGDLVVPALKGLGRPSWILILEVVQSSLLLASIWWMTARFGVVGAALAWIPAVLASQVLAAALLRRLLERPFHGLSQPLAVLVAIVAAGGAASLLVDQLIPGLVGLAAAVAGAVILVGWLLWMSERQYDLGLLGGLIRAFPQLATLLGLTSPGAEEASVH